MFDLTCKDAARLLLQAAEQPLTLREQLGLRFHLAICAMCPPFARQVQFMRRALGRWKAYADDDDGDNRDSGSGGAPPR